MSACGEADDADLFGVQLPWGGVLMEDFEGAAGVKQGGWVALGVAAVEEDGRGDALGFEEIGDLNAFVFEADDSVAAAGNDEGARGGSLRGIGGLGEPNAWGLDVFCVSRGGEGFGAEGLIGGCGWGASPELDFLESAWNGDGGASALAKQAGAQGEQAVAQVDAEVFHGWIFGKKYPF